MYVQTVSFLDAVSLCFSSMLYVQLIKVDSLYSYLLDYSGTGCNQVQEKEEEGKEKRKEAQEEEEKESQKRK